MSPQWNSSKLRQIRYPLSHVPQTIFLWFQTYSRRVKIPMFTNVSIKSNRNVILENYFKLTIAVVRIKTKIFFHVVEENFFFKKPCFYRTLVIVYWLTSVSNQKKAFLQFFCYGGGWKNTWTRYFYCDCSLSQWLFDSVIKGPTFSWIIIPSTVKLNFQKHILILSHTSTFLTQTTCEWTLDNW